MKKEGTSEYTRDVKRAFEEILDDVIKDMGFPTDKPKLPIIKIN